MKIEGASKSHHTSDTRKAKKTGDTSSFSTGEAKDMAPITEPFEVTGVVSCDALLSLQEALTLSPEDRRSVETGHQLLDDLEDVHKGLLLGRFSRSSLERMLKKISENRERANIPALENLIEQIELRVEVELAKLSYSRESE